MRNNISSSESECLKKIELRRSELRGSNKSINITDFGAGSSNSNRTQGEMEQGVELDISISKVAAASKPKFWATFLFLLVRKLKPNTCIELGSCVGISASYQATALSLNGNGTLTTLEGSNEIARLAKETIELLNLNNVNVITGPFHKTLDNVLESSQPIDFFFNDGHHDRDAVLRYFNLVMSYLSKSSIIVIDDISWSSGMREAWEKIESDKRVAISIDLQTIGIVIIDETISKEKFSIPL